MSGRVGQVSSLKVDCLATNLYQAEVEEVQAKLSPEGWGLAFDIQEGDPRRPMGSRLGASSRFSVLMCTTC